HYRAAVVARGRRRLQDLLRACLAGGRDESARFLAYACCPVQRHDDGHCIWESLALHHPGTSSMGKLLSLSLVTTLAAAVLFQPILMGPPPQAMEPSSTPQAEPVAATPVGRNKARRVKRKRSGG